MRDSLQEGNDSYRRGDAAGAAVHYRRALAERPDSFIAHYNLGVACTDADEDTEALQHFRTALALQPACAPAHNYLGILAEKVRDYPAAVAHYRRALGLEPNFADAHFNLGMLLLRLGHLAEGFAECEWRWRTARFTPLRCPHPRWDGLFLRGTLLVHTEQGAGDAIQFARSLPEAARRCERVMLVCPENLLRLFGRVPGLAELRTAGEIPHQAFQAFTPLLSLPHLFGTTLNNIPARVPYLEPPGTFELPPHPAAGARLKVGIAWAGSPTHANDRNRSCHLRELAPLLDVDGVAWYSLQKGPQAEQLRELVRPEHVCDLGPSLTDFADTAGAIAQLDLVVSVDTSVAHLAGALGRPVWVLLGRQSDWRWLVDREDTPWYPTMRLFRQEQARDWRGPVARVAAALRERLQTESTAAEARP